MNLVLSLASMWRLQLLSSRFVTIVWLTHCCYVLCVRCYKLFFHPACCMEIIMLFTFHLILHICEDSF